jgi:hypothetical protein
VDFQTFEKWMKKLSEADLLFLRRDPMWKKEYEKIKEGRVLPKGFVEKTMEMLEGGSESET